MKTDTCHEFSLHARLSALAINYVGPFKVMRAAVGQRAAAAPADGRLRGHGGHEAGGARPAELGGRRPGEGGADGGGGEAAGDGAAAAAQGAGDGGGDGREGPARLHRHEAGAGAGAGEGAVGAALGHAVDVDEGLLLVGGLRRLRGVLGVGGVAAVLSHHLRLAAVLVRPNLKEENTE